MAEYLVRAINSRETFDVLNEHFEDIYWYIDEETTNYVVINFEERDPAEQFSQMTKRPD